MSVTFVRLKAKTWISSTDFSNYPQYWSLWKSVHWRWGGDAIWYMRTNSDDKPDSRFSQFYANAPKSDSHCVVLLWCRRGADVEITKCPQAQRFVTESKHQIFVSSRYNYRIWNTTSYC